MYWKKRKKRRQLMQKHNCHTYTQYHKHLITHCILTGYWKAGSLTRMRAMCKLDGEFSVEKFCDMYHVAYKQSRFGVIWSKKIQKSVNDIAHEVVSNKQYPELEEDWKQRLLSAIEERIMDPKFDYIPSYCVTPPDPFTTALMAGIHGELMGGDQT